jgi:hypothetical protein
MKIRPVRAEFLADGHEEVASHFPPYICTNAPIGNVKRMLTPNVDQREKISSGFVECKVVICTVCL